MKIRRRLKRTAVADMTPMIDIIFQLVIFFMISSVFNTAPGIDIQLPNSEGVQPLEVTPLIITVKDDNTIFVNKNLVPMDSLKTALGEFSNKDDKTQTVVLKGDTNISYGTFLSIMGILRNQGFEQINMISEPSSGQK